MANTTLSAFKYQKPGKTAVVCAWCLLVVVPLGCGSRASDDYDVLNDVKTGDEALARIVPRSDSPGRDANAVAFAESVSNVYYCDGGTFNGMYLYWSFDCANLDDCWDAIQRAGGPDQSTFTDWKLSQYAVVMLGPEFYSPKLATALWDVRLIQRGVAYEKVEGGNRRLIFYAIDFDKLRVYHHYESGGFDDRRYRN
ncbi:MAG: hypothetical protein JSS02_26105 [Planctomycetes bacterium]|nr:hypothetical protein [Planctomycetota bacterium]